MSHAFPRRRRQRGAPDLPGLWARVLKRRVVTHDFETRSMADLKKQGAYKYSLDPTTKPTCLAIKVHGQRKITFLDFHQINLRWEDHTPEFRNWWKGLIRDGYLFSAHNSFFEWCIYENILVARLGWPSIPLEQRRCTAAKAAACALPRSLEKAGQALKLSMQKDRRGYSAMMATCKPTKAWNAWKKANDKFFSITFGGKGRITDRLRKVACAPEPPVFLEPEAAPDVWKTLYHYCEFDVRVEEVLDEELPDLSPEEQQIWILNQRLNWRGLRIDIPTVDKIVDMMAAESKVKLKELDALTMGLITKPGARNSILEFLKLDGIELPNLKAKTVDDALSGFGLTPDMHRLLEIRKALTMTSTKKYYAMQDRACDDHRVRDILLYHGSSTGRDTGNGLQPHNFPRGILRVDKRRPYAAVENVVNCDPEMLRLLYGDTLAMLFSSILRNMIIPTDGYELFVADFSKIEVAVLWWLAGNEAGLQALRDGKDPYIFQASQNTGKSYAEIESAVGREEKWALDARQLGKAQVLGCFEADTLVLTDRGWKKIVDVSAVDRVWDGIEWVNHEGVAYQGMKATIRCRGVGVTPGHLFMTPGGWAPASRVAHDDILYRKSTIDSDSFASKGTSWAPVAASFRSSSAVPVHHGGRTRSTFMRFGGARAPAAPAARRNGEHRHESIGGVTRTSYRTTHIGNDFSIGSPLQFSGAMTRARSVSPTTGAAVSVFSKPGEMTERNSWPTLYHFRGGTNRILRWTESRTTRATYRETSVFPLVTPTSSIEGKFRNCSNESTTLKPVFDIVNAGPRNRFMIFSEGGPVIVHNCGFGMGWENFQSTAWVQHRLKLTDDQSIAAVSSYRKSNEAVPAFWKAAELAAIAAVERPGTVHEAGRCRFSVSDDFLWLELPSGRRLAFREPQVAWRTKTVGDKTFDAKTLEFWGVNPKTKQWALERSWGGIMVQNATQGTARDLMMPAMVRLEASGYRALLMIHDEGLAEKKIGRGSVDEFTRILCQPPAWARGLPIEAKGWVGPRYRK